MGHPAGWYPDGTTPNILRWWDGRQWTEHTTPSTPEQAVAPTLERPSAPTNVTGPPTTGPVPGAGALGPPPAGAQSSPFAGTQSSPFGSGGIDGSGTKPWWKRWWAIAGAAVIALVVVAAAFGSAGDDDAAVPVDTADDGPVDTDALDDEPDPESDSVPAVASDPEIEPDAEPATEPEAEPESDDGAEQLANGSPDRPFRYGDVVPVAWDSFGDADRAVWNTSVSAPRDIGAEVLAENSFNEPPPEGVAFLGFDVSLTLIESGKDPLSTGFNLRWEVFGGATSGVYDSLTLDTDSFGCGVVPDEFDQFAEAFRGGTISGTVCVPVPAEDVGDAATRVAITFTGGDRVLFASSGQPGPAPLAVPTPEVVAASGSGPADGSRQLPYPFDVAVEVDFATFGDADGSVWTTTVGPPRDLTAAVADENPFNDPPEDGLVYVGFDVSMTLESADQEPLSPYFNFDWEVLGGSTARPYRQFTLSSGCGVTPNQFDSFSEVLIGGTLTGTVCIPVPIDDQGHSGTGIAMNFADGERIVFHD